MTISNSAGEGKSVPSNVVGDLIRLSVEQPRWDAGRANGSGRIARAHGEWKIQKLRASEWGDAGLRRNGEASSSSGRIQPNRSRISALIDNCAALAALGQAGLWPNPRPIMPEPATIGQ